VRALGARVCSKAAGAGQWAAVLALALGLSAGGCSRHSKAPDEAAAQSGGRQTPSGLPVPRYVSLKFDKVNARGGPGDDYDLKWVYRVKGLPVQVVAETDEWRRVCDAQGSLSWVHRRTTDARRTVMRNAAEALTLRSGPTETAGAAATLVGHAIAELKTCQGGWCQVAVGRTKGWAPADQLWGLDPTPQCH
jgi:SH3-like domain-containing protein